jgi:hypothetical protein
MHVYTIRAKITLNPVRQHKLSQKLRGEHPMQHNDLGLEVARQYSSLINHIQGSDREVNRQENSLNIQHRAKSLAVTVMWAGPNLDEAIAIADAAELPRSSPGLISPGEDQPQELRQG